ncbi:MAG: 16S rRNA (guanine(966)-N(2))-methyltransferase RsmD [Deltaproteobacteria bacterium]|nr:16S rRNA (guanine(966)-N(2))-methyltransferase RsmD [Deltaproteobacteria bacterium]
MRIIGGDARGKQLFLPKGCPIRPTADLVKGALFSVLRSVSEVSFLDLFAGSGSVGIEALSRGAAKAVFVERNRSLAHAIADNLSRCGFDARSEILAADVKSAIRILSERQVSFDIVFADPPYDTGFIDLTLQYLAVSSVISREGLLVLQHSVREKLPEKADKRFILTDQRRYGDTVLSFLKITD